MRRAGIATVLVALACVPFAGCATCRPDEPRVQPRGAGGASIGASGVTPTMGMGLDLSNLFCREPDPRTRPQPGPADEPIPDLPKGGAGAPAEEGDAGSARP